MLKKEGNNTSFFLKLTKPKKSVINKQLEKIFKRFESVKFYVISRLKGLGRGFKIVKTIHFLLIYKEEQFSFIYTLFLNTFIISLYSV